MLLPGQFSFGEERRMPRQYVCSAAFSVLKWVRPALRSELDPVFFPGVVNQRLPSVS